MNTVIRNYVSPLVGTVDISFDKYSFGHVLKLALNIVKQIKERDSEKLKVYLALCIQEWKTSDACPIEKKILMDAVSVIEESE